MINTIQQNIGLPDIFRSKRFWTAALGLFFMVLVEFIPAIAGSADMLQQSAFALVGLLIGGYIGQDTIIAVKTGASKYQPESA